MSEDTPQVPEVLKPLPTIEELLSSIVPHDPQPHAKYVDTAPYRALTGRRKAYKFAMLYIKHGFEARAAMREFLADMGRPWTNSSKKTATHYANSKWVAQYVRELVQRMQEKITTNAANELDRMIELNRMLIYGDIFNLVEQVGVYEPAIEAKDGKPGREGRWVTLTRLKNLGKLSKAERMMCKKIRFYKTGEVASIEAYDRLDAERAQLAVLELQSARGGSDAAWLTDFRERISDARRKAIDFEVKRGKVVHLPITKQSA